MSNKNTEQGHRVVAWTRRNAGAVAFNVCGFTFAEVWSLGNTGAFLNVLGLVPVLLTSWFLISMFFWWNRRRVKRAIHRLPDPGLIATLRARWVEFWHVWTVNHRWQDFCKVNKFTSTFTKQVPRLNDMDVSLEGDVEVFVTPSKMGIAGTESKTPIERLIGLRPALEDMCECKIIMRRADNGVRIKFLWTDPLERVLSIEQLPMTTTTKRIPFAVWESGDAATLNPNLSTLVYGRQGSGKSSLAWTYISVLLARNVPTDLYIVDPKGGQEWGWLQRLALAEDCPIRIKGFAKNGAEAEPMVKQALEQVRARQEKLGTFDLEDFSKDPTRQHVPTVEEPYVLVLIDELLHVRNLLKDTATNPSVVGQIISIGRSASAAIVAVTQDPTKEVVGMVRDLFGQRICLRSASPQATSLVLYEGAEATGAAASKIPEDQPGLCYFYDAESGVLNKARIAHVTDAHIKKDIQYGRAPRGMGVERGAEVREREDGIYKFWGHLDRLPAAWRQWYTKGLPHAYGPGGGIVCLYVGHGLEPLERLKDHSGAHGKPAKKWWDYVDHSLTLPPEWRRNTAEALAYEEAEIKRLCPIGNEQHNKQNPWRAKLELVGKPERRRLLPTFGKRELPVVEPVAASVEALSVRSSAIAGYAARRPVRTFPPKGYPVSQPTLTEDAA